MTIPDWRPPRDDTSIPYYRAVPPEQFVHAAHREVSRKIVQQWGQGTHGQLADLERCAGFGRIVRCWIIDSATRQDLWDRATVGGLALLCIAQSPDGGPAFEMALADRERERSGQAPPPVSAETLLRRAAVQERLPPDYYLQFRPAPPSPNDARNMQMLMKMMKRNVELLGRTGTPSAAMFNLRQLVPSLELDGQRVFDPEYLKAPGAAIAEILACLGVYLTSANVARELRRLGPTGINSRSLLPR